MMNQIDLRCNAGSYGTGRRLRLLTWGLQGSVVPIDLVNQWQPAVEPALEAHGA